jgi:hypothetical protein
MERKGNTKMAKKTENDTIILGLKKQIEDKKKALKASEKFSPQTNCSLDWNGGRYNLHVLPKEIIIGLLLELNSKRLSRIDLGIGENDYLISGYSIEAWMADLKAKLLIVDRKAEEARLQAMEAKLHNLLSVDTKVALEIDEISKMI